MKNFEEYTPEKPVTPTARVIDTVNKVESRLFAAVVTVNNRFNSALIETTETLGEPRLTEYMQSQIEPGVLPNSDYLAILEKIQPGAAEQVFSRAEAINDASIEAERRAALSPRQLGKHLLKGMASISIFPSRRN